jgi:hypothetical protein
MAALHPQRWRTATSKNQRLSRSHLQILGVAFEPLLATSGGGAQRPQGSWGGRAATPDHLWGWCAATPRMRSHRYCLGVAWWQRGGYQTGNHPSAFFIIII